MPITHLLTPTGSPLSFAEAPDWYDGHGLMPRAAVQRVIDDIAAESGKHVRPSDVVPEMNCRRRRVYEATTPYGVNPLDEWAKHEGTAIHEYLGSEEIEVPGDGERAPVCGVPMRGHIDILDNRVVDIKSTSPFWIAKFPPKGATERRPFAAIYERPEAEDVGKWQPQLSIYAILLGKSGRPAPTEGEVWRAYRGVKGSQGAWKRFRFPLLTEEELERKYGGWIRGLASALVDEDPKAVEPDGRKFVGSRGNLWCCDSCPFRRACDEASPGWASF